MEFVEEVLSLMKQRNVQLDVVTYNSLLLAKRDDPSAVQQLNPELRIVLKVIRVWIMIRIKCLKAARLESVAL